MKIKNKKTFIRAIAIITLTIATLILTHYFWQGLRDNGLNSLFTCQAYREAFKSQLKIDNWILYGFEIVCQIMVIGSMIANLDYYQKIDNLERGLI